jgi:hypothetical protein
MRNERRNLPWSGAQHQNDTLHQISESQRGAFERRTVIHVATMRVMRECHLRRWNVSKRDGGRFIFRLLFA